MKRISPHSYTIAGTVTYTQLRFLFDVLDRGSVDPKKLKPGQKRTASSLFKRRLLMRVPVRGEKWITSTTRGRVFASEREHLL